MFAALLLLAILVGDDTTAITVYRHGLLNITSYLGSVPVDGTKLPTREERQNARLMWRSFLDYQLALESIRTANSDFLERSGAARNRGFRQYFAAWLAQYRTALQFIEAAERHPEYHSILNERDPTLGLVSGAYSDFKFRWLNVARAGEFATFALLDSTLGGTDVPGAREDARYLLAAGQRSGPAETMRNAARIVQSAAWQPVPAGLAAVAGGQEKPAPRPSFVPVAEIAKVRKQLEPGDLIFERRDWELSNIGLPGFWSHVALYIGSPSERRRSFGEDPLPDPKLAHVTVIEAIGEGVIVSTFEHSADADYVAVVRPTVPPPKKAEAIARAVRYLGRPYDFEFDFATDDRIVCTELVYKSYEGALHLPVMRLAGRNVTPANDFVRWFDEVYDGPRELEFVAFLDGHARGDLATFRASWKRPRWYSATEESGRLGRSGRASRPATK